MSGNSGLSREAEDRIERICGALLGFVFGAIAFTTTAAQDWRAVVAIVVVMVLILWRDAHPRRVPPALRGTQR